MVWAAEGAFINRTGCW